MSAATALSGISIRDYRKGRAPPRLGAVKPTRAEGREVG
jgi:hypothetical protein